MDPIANLYTLEMALRIEAICNFGYSYPYVMLLLTTSVARYCDPIVSPFTCAYAEHQRFHGHLHAGLQASEAAQL